MPEGNGSGRDRLDRAEEIIAHLLEHARVTDEQQDRQDRQIAALTQTSIETNLSIASLVGALRELIDRMPPESLGR